MSLEKTGYRSKTVEELISIIHMRDRMIDEIKQSANHQVYMSMCQQLIDLKHSLDVSENINANYLKWFQDHEYLTTKRPN